MANPLVELQKLGQSIWYDNIRRAMLVTGDLERKIKEDDLKGVTSNPAIFEKAIGGSTDYNEALNELAGQGKSVDEIYEEIAIQDIQSAADLFRSVYEKTDRVDGYVSLEVSPHLAHDTDATIDEAKRLWDRLGRKNVMIKVPATSEGMPAIEALIAAGINVNVTLIFSRAVYQQVMDAYLSGLEKRARAGEPLDHIASVASFFVSRIDTAVDNAVEFRLRRSDSQSEQDKLRSLLGNVAIANAKLAYQTFKETFGSERFRQLDDNGARVQRPLWASTGTKNANYSDVLYVESLIGPDTVNTVPPATFTGFRDHGRVELTLEKDIDDAGQTLSTLEEVGISLDQITDDLLKDGVKAFVEPFDKLMKAIEEKREAAIGSIVERQSVSLGQYSEDVDKTLKLMDEQQYVRRLWRKDATLWKKEKEHQKIIENALGWLTVLEIMLDQAGELQTFAERVKNDGFKYAMLLGMGGSSLCPEVFRRTFGHVRGYPELLVLDSTDPATVKSMEQTVDIGKTLFIVASKSGTTTEPLSFYKYFFDKVAQTRKDRPGANFIAITDPGTPLEKMALEKKFRRIFINPADIGGRYSALSYFGMVPAALMGLDVHEILDRAVRADLACERVIPTDANPGARLGAILGTLAKQGRDKVTFITPPPIDSLGLWIEQLIAESTGKEGRGILPVAGEPLGDPDVYEDDRVFVYIHTGNARPDEIESRLKALERAGHPVIRHMMRDESSLGREFFIWEMATAIAGALMGINAFDQPNVQESKDNTVKLLNMYREEGKFPSQEILLEGDEGTLYADSKNIADLKKSAQKGNGSDALESYVRAHLSRAKKGDYVALTAYIQENDAHEHLLQKIRRHIRDSLKTATTVGYGPRFLHSTGQLHKGGADNGLFIQITSEEAEDVPIPSEPHTFGVLKQAQALGDFQSLSNR
ncbi:bifunctional transaldolase/phosoglucose isomerase, partial [candidate division KSB1 bacterium]|nr:bifunctional transaldolase/phosoglucose isomerase [candidate division KSB1 bacterium]NIR70670.1 bifunctional transaldolase/phosoglucose isomerase [candidate division KSB1 bacterium]NIS26022.1 bifunctional transaldolase/phosoglucose isomerase [candidate division KSB1 bacterium]NIT72846.1 bifunctional transaldolase/phosoglucose isomerase [candidate division KSB1 bacterium]NIU26687.1 bifunctional transaldolase/phosoglucose isomerase [candidate division KSB1 bacterium]